MPYCRCPVGRHMAQHHATLAVYEALRQIARLTPEIETEVELIRETAAEIAARRDPCADCCDTGFLVD